jgi:hypothetical protein
MVLTLRQGVAHPTCVLSVLRRLSLCVLSLALVTASVRECAGWQATPEARMACCEKGGTCPMRKKAAPGAAKSVLTQSEADACCAASEPQSSQQSGDALATTITVAVLGTPAVMAEPTPGLVLTDRWRTVTPLPATPVPKHVLLSVFLI